MLNNQEIYNRDTFGRIPSSNTLKKLSPLDNPYHQNNDKIALSVLNFSKFNDRNKIRLTQSVCSDEESEDSSFIDQISQIESNIPLRSSTHTKIETPENEQKDEPEQQAEQQVNQTPQQMLTNQIQDVQEQFHENLSNMEEIENQDFESISTTLKKTKVNVLRDNKLSLSLALSNAQNSQQHRQLMIDRFKNHTSFAQSKAVEQEPSQNNLKAGMTDRRRPRRKIFERNFKKRQKDAGYTPQSTTRNTTPNRPHKIFEEKELKLSYVITHPNHCIHDCCISRSIQIIDRISKQKQEVEKRDLETSKINKFSKIQLDIAEIEMQIEELALNIRLENLCQKVTETEAIKNSIEHLFKKMKEEDNFNHCLQISKQSSNQTIESVNSLYKRVNLLLLIQKNMKRWKNKLNEDDLEGIDLSDSSKRIELARVFYGNLQALEEELVFLDEDSSQGTLKQVVRTYRAYLKKQVKDIKQLLVSLNSMHSFSK